MMSSYEYILFLTILGICFALVSAKNNDAYQELLLCRKCGADIADSNYITHKLSPGARKVKMKDMFGKQNVTVQTLVNPFGINFEIITLEKASCDNIGSRQGADSWFPGHTWRICTCPHCGHHLGWTFEPSNERDHSIPDSYYENFHGLILSNILGENCKDKILPNKSTKIEWIPLYPLRDKLRLLVPLYPSVTRYRDIDTRSPYNSINNDSDIH